MVDSKPEGHGKQEAGRITDFFQKILTEQAFERRTQIC
jgi:hypothetical protein